LAEQRLLLRTGRDPRLQPRGRRSRRHSGARAHGQHGLRRRRSPLPLHHGFDLGVPYSRACPGAAGALSDTIARAKRLAIGGSAMLHVIILLLATLLALPLAAEAQKPIKVGMPMPLSGPPALFGEPASKGAQMFVEELNAKGGVLGRKVELRVRVSKAFVEDMKKIKPSVQNVEQQWPKLGEQDYNPFINAQMAKKPEAIFSSIWGGFFVTYSKQAKALGVFDAIKYNFIGVGGAAT